MYILIIVLIVQVYSEQLDTQLWRYTRTSCQDNCLQYGLGECDQHQLIQANSPEKIQQIVKERIHSAYNCVDYVKGNDVGYVRTGWFDFKCYYIDPELEIEDTVETCNRFSDTNNLCSCSHHEHTFMSHEPTTQPTSQPTITSQPTNEPTSQPTNEPTNEPTFQPTNEPIVLSEKSEPNNKSNNIILSETTIIILLLIIATILIVFVISSILCKRFYKETNIVNVEEIIPVSKFNEIPIAQAHIIQSYPQPTAPPLQLLLTTEKIDIEMGLEIK